MNRDLMFAFVAPNVKDKNATPKSLFPFSWEEEVKNVDLHAAIEAVEESKKRWNARDGIED